MFPQMHPAHRYSCVVSCGYSALSTKIFHHPPFLGPSRRIIFFSCNDFRYGITALLLIPRISAISCVVILRCFLISARIDNSRSDKFTTGVSGEVFGEVFGANLDDRLARSIKSSCLKMGLGQPPSSSSLYILSTPSPNSRINSYSFIKDAILGLREK